MLQSMGALDRTVAVARAYAADHRDTLVVVTGDHETGGLIVRDRARESGTVASAEDGPFAVKDSSQRFVLRWTTNRHTGKAVPVTAYGPLAERFTGKHRNTYVHDVLAPVLTR
jgi:alkaline phosphatase